MGDFAHVITAQKGSMSNSPWRPATRRCIVVVGLCALLLGASDGADREQYDRNWPQWRGPAANGLVLHGNPPLTWAEDKNVKWKVAIPGLGHATPIIWDDKIFIL